MAELECRRVVERSRLALDGLDNRCTVMAGIRAPQAGGTIDQPASVAGDVVHVLGAHEHPRPFFEGAVGGEGHPVGFEIVGNGDFCLCLRRLP